VITNGVVGNVMIKLAEGLSAGIFRALATEVLDIDPSLAMPHQPRIQPGAHHHERRAALQAVRRRGDQRHARQAPRVVHGGPGMIQPCGVRLAGTGSAVPDTRLTNHDLARILDTSDEWITQRTGIRERRISAGTRDPVFNLSCRAGQHALDMAGVKASDIDLVILGTVSGEMLCPSTSCRVAAALGATPAGAFDLTAACCGFVYSMNVADSIIRAGRAKRVLAIGCDAISSVVDYTDRTVSILFGDAAGAVVLERCDDPAKGCRYQTMSADGADWHHLYMPYRPDIVPECDRTNPIRLGNLRMNGREVYKFAVNRFREVIEDMPSGRPASRWTTSARSSATSPMRASSRAPSRS